MKPSDMLPTLPLPLVREAVRVALLEDLGRAGDITSAATIPAAARARLVIGAREAGILCGMDLAEEAFRAMDGAIEMRRLMTDGDRLAPGAIVAEVEGPAQAILSGERTALNFLMHLSGVASLTQTYAARIAHTKARVTCTRKTVPGLRALQKYAVRCGGGSNHRFGLDDAILIKDNHVAVAGGVAEAVWRARAYAGHLVAVEVEVDTLEQLEEAMTAGPNAVLLDNMTPEQLARGIAIVAGRAAVEASGNISLATIGAVAESGVDYISTSKITMSAPSLDLGLDIRID
ncbi:MULTISPECIES: carboxylating nicotinate-nucleotide diphosphorylase [unclassified Aureimonas]|uniref:carboxylating nicotinate-nucleotide diphosphorylase n=1 Tax=unclassified Aureimonas TaxID=2615206 RepID=UPI0007007E6D|nr:MULTISPECIES: carboxylating nicotinate-nucleotide diphosphorylase [unclassified Aureimonas]KQT55316.1 nicotinate-nucleotide pyrophosphorylase [Aureimonas sp. Leaf427]KQT71107.1 nicotinate-nucleotide pyrophosphorylase [Aureimonas sp. Leaf460]